MSFYFTNARRAVAVLTATKAPVREFKLPVQSRLLSTVATRSTIGSISVSPALKGFVDQKVLPGTGVSSESFWSGLDSIVTDLMPLNTSLLREREMLQQQIDDWHRANPAPYDTDAYMSFLKRIGYVEAAAAVPFEVETEAWNTDTEIANVAGPQLVCPIDNTRFILNAANARWGSLLDALYATNAVAGLPGSAAGPYDPERGAAVFAAAHRLLDEFFPLTAGTWDEVESVRVAGGTLLLGLSPQGNSQWASEARTEVGLREDASSFVGYAADSSGALSVVLQRHRLRLEVVVDPTGGGRAHKAGIVDLRLESALSAICDFEDSACTVDVDDKVRAYANWLGLMDRSLSETVEKKDGGSTRRTLHPPRFRRSPEAGGTIELPGQALLLARNVGMHMHHDMVTTTSGGHSEPMPVPEHFVDAMVTAAAALHDVRALRANSRHGCIYIVKPKMHGRREAALAAQLMGRVEQVLRLPPHTIRIGLMDEERRTSANLAPTMAALKERLFFVNTGFLDRTADEIHTSMEAGPVLPKEAIKMAAWYGAYEKGNVATAMRAALVGRGQVGKGMWAEPEDMAAMLSRKGAQLEAGASTAWVPSPAAATLHALHYLRVSVASVQQAMVRGEEAAERADERLKELLTPPLLGSADALSPEEVQAELENNAQGLLGYVVRWVGQGVGCSKVPDLHGTQLMEDRATLRISSQHIANWLHHGLVSEEQVMETMRRAASLVDAQNSADKSYVPLAPSYDTPEWHAAVDLIFHGRDAPNGYTEATLAHWRRVRKAGAQVKPRASTAARPTSSPREAGAPWSDAQSYRLWSSMGGAM